MASAQGIRVRHGRACATRASGRCNCEPTYEAWVWSKRDGKKIRKAFPTQAAAKGWRIDALKAVQDKKLRAPSPKTLRQEVDEWLAGAREGRILNKRKQPYKPAVVRNYEVSLRLRVLPEFGDRRLDNITHADLLTLQEELLGDGHSGSTIRNTFVPLQAIFRRAYKLGIIPMNPATDLELPTAGTRDRAARPVQVAELLDTLDDGEAAIWATAFYAGLRRGEIQALRVQDVDFDTETIRVERGWDAKEGPIAPKSHAGTRAVFMLEALRSYLEPLRERRNDPEALFFGSDALSAFEPRSTERRARKALKKANEKRVAESGEELAPVEWFGLHEARHSFSTFMDHAGISETRADRYMGHAAPGVAGRYRHLLPGQIAEDASRLDEYLSGAIAGKVVEMKRPAVG